MRGENREPSGIANRKTIELSVNGETVRALVEPRLQLADFLRDHLLLTGTHLGCEHGVCGACTVEIDGAPARSCIAYAVACNGAAVRTVEGFEDDSVMAALREAFSAEHALQCGYCTPGMLVTARDIVLRLPNADEARIREELAGNLCRCTGYVGIVRAIQRVLAQPATDAQAAEEAPRRVLASPDFAADVPMTAPRLVARDRPTERSQRGDPETIARAAPANATPQTTLHQTFSVEHPRDDVWKFFGRLDEVTTCLPGASLVHPPTNDHVQFILRVKLGPIVAEFEGAADVVRDASNYTGTIHGSARDRRSTSITRGEVRYALIEEKDGAATRVDLDVGFTLTGALAQFSRSGIVQDIASRMTEAFARNLESRLDPRDNASVSSTARLASSSELDAGALFFSALRRRVGSFLRSLWRKS